MLRQSLLILVALIGMAAQQPPDESTVPDNEKRVPPGTVCKRPDVPIRPQERAVHCDCTYSCEIDTDGNVVEHESSTCSTYCHVNGRRCSCWPEGDPQHPCEHTGDQTRAHGLIDMDGRLVAVFR